MNPGSLRYRPEIDGLRAVAVLIVAFFHAEILGITGGFVGVDVFFVISGFLIARIIWGESLEGRFSIARFYERRIRRILPALMAMAIFVIGFTLLYQTPREARAFGESISFFGLFASNHFFLQERGYFDAPVERFALLHTWSLAVEEQFYIFFPLMLAAIAAYARRRVGLIVGAVALLSLVASVAAVQGGYERLAFFTLPFRIWELMLGALLAVGAVPAVTRPATREAMAAIGLALIAACAVFYSKTTPFPGLAAIPPCLGVALLIHADTQSQQFGQTRVGWALSRRPVVFVGLVSYSFYLWHWPALSFATYYAMRPLEGWEAAAALAASFLAAVGSYYLIERPFRRPMGVLRRPALFGAAAAALAFCIALGVVLQETRGLPGRLPDNVQAMTTGDAVEFGVDRDCQSERDRLSPEARAAISVLFCRLGDLSRTPRTLLWGDSHALGVSPGFEEGARTAGLSLMLVTRAACPPVVGYEYYPTSTWKDCLRHNQAVYDSLKRLGVERVLLFAAWGNYTSRVRSGEVDPYDQTELGRRLRMMIEGIRAKGIEVVIGDAVPIYDLDVPSALSRAVLFGHAAPIDTSLAAYEQRHAPDLAIIRGLAKEYGLTLFPLHEQFCDARTCEIERDGRPLYADHGHLNVLAARPLGPLLAPLVLP